jgi:hypothetical protein
MSELNLAPAQVIGAVQSENANIPAGFVDLGPRSFSLKTSGSYSSLDQVRDTVIASIDGRIVRIRDVAEVSWSTAAYSHTGRYKGKRAVFVTANQKDGYNILDVRERVMAATHQFAAGLPKRITLEVGFDQSDNVRNRLNRLYIDFGIEPLKRAHPKLVSMKANTAICLMLAGFAVACLRHEGTARWKLLIARICAVIVGLTGVLTLAQHLGHWDFGIDQFLFKESLEEAGQSFPGRMGPASALNFILLSAGILLLDVRPRRGSRGRPRSTRTTRPARP